MSFLMFFVGKSMPNHANQLLVQDVPVIFPYVIKENSGRRSATEADNPRILLKSSLLTFECQPVFFDVMRW